MAISFVEYKCLCTYAKVSLSIWLSVTHEMNKPIVPRGWDQTNGDFTVCFNNGEQQTIFVDAFGLEFPIARIGGDMVAFSLAKIEGDVGIKNFKVRIDRTVKALDAAFPMQGPATGIPVGNQDLYSFFQPATNDAVTAHEFIEVPEDVAHQNKMTPK